MMEAATDDRLARRAAKGDRRAFEAIYRRYHQDLYRFCLAMAGNPQDAQEALQNTMVKVLRSLPGERRRIELKPWLYRIARNEAIETRRRRRDSVELEPERASAGPQIAETAEARDRLRGLIADLEELPERQRAALLLREMAGLGFEQIGRTFETSAATARQTVYEARLSLRQMEAGREMDCDAVTRELSDADGRTMRKREIRAHLRDCPSCRAFRDEIAARRGDFAAIAPLPLAASAALLHGSAGAAGVGVGGAGGAASVGAAAVASSGAVKAAATVAVVAVVGVTAADRTGLVDAPVFGGEAAAPRVAAPSAGSPGGAAGPIGPAALPRSGAGGKPTRGESGKPTSSEAAAAAPAGRRDKQTAGDATGTGGRSAPGAAMAAPRSRLSHGQQPPGGGHGRHRGKPQGLPTASQKGQQTAAARKPPQAKASPGPPPESPGGSAAGKRASAQTPPHAAPSPPAESGAAPEPSGGPPEEPPAPVKPGPPAQGQAGEDPPPQP